MLVGSDDEAGMGLRSDYDRIGDLVLLCAQTMRKLSAEKRAQGIECPFKPSSFLLEALSREIKDIAANLPPDWDREPRRDLN